MSLETRLLARRGGLPRGATGTVAMSSALVAAAAFGLLAGFGSTAGAAVVLDGTSGANVYAGPLSTDGDITINLGFFADVLVVGGGGSGGMDRDSGGGGGAGGLVFVPNRLVSGHVSVEVGDGGARRIGSGTSHGPGSGGQASVFGDLVALGGGAGGTRDGGRDGASGGGGGAGTLSNATSSGGAGRQTLELGDSGQFGFGTDGGGGVSRSNRDWSRSGGGGGAGMAGSFASDSFPYGQGGDGLSEVTLDGITYRFADLFGTQYGQTAGSGIAAGEAWFAGGGGGGSRESVNPGAGGKGGGGSGGKATGQENGSGRGADALTNTGGGGGGAGTRGTGTWSGAGGFGIVMLRYAGAEVAGAGGNNVFTQGGHTVHAFTTTGSSAFDLSGVDMNARLGVTVTQAVTGTGGLTFAGPGRLALAEQNTYQGPTTIAAGTLALSGIGSINTSPAIDVRAGATFDVSGRTGGSYTIGGGQTLTGSGTIVGDLVMDGGSILAPGGSTGRTLTFDAGSRLALSPGAALHWQFDQPGTAGIDYDSITGGALYLPETAPIVLNIFGPGANLTFGDSFTLFDGDVFDHNATLFAPGHDLSGLFHIVDHSGWWGTWEVTAGSLVLTAVPEPGTWLLLLSALACGLLWRRRGGGVGFMIYDL